MYSFAFICSCFQKLSSYSIQARTNKTFDLLDGQNSAFCWGEEGLENFHQMDFIDTKNVDREDT